MMGMWKNQLANVQQKNQMPQKGMIPKKNKNQTNKNKQQKKQIKKKTKKKK